VGSGFSRTYKVSGMFSVPLSFKLP
jgi:hypothetical protein